MRIGDLEIQPVLDGTARLPIREAYEGVSDEAWEPHRLLLDIGKAQRSRFTLSRP